MGEAATRTLIGEVYYKREDKARKTVQHTELEDYYMSSRSSSTSNLWTH